MKFCPFISTSDKPKNCDTSCMFFDPQNVIERCKVKYFMQKTIGELDRLQQDIDELKRKR